MIFYDTETCGLHGMATLIQYAKNDGEIKLYSPWKEQVGDTLALIEEIISDDVIGFNLAFDHFHLCKLYTTFSQLDTHSYPEDIVDEVAIAEEKARWNGPCLKPKRACDLMLHARKGPYQTLMARENIRIKRVPTPLAWELCKMLEARVELDSIYFARRKDKWAPHFKVFNIKNSDGEINPHFKDIVLKFHPSGALKTLAKHALKVKETLLYQDIEPELRPAEYGYAPFALAVGKPGNWKNAWPDLITLHSDHWAYNPLARKYAGDDVDYTRRLWHHFGEPEPGDDDSELACMVAAVRWKGFAIDFDKLKVLKEKTRAKIKKTPMAPKQARYYITEVMDETSKLVLQGSTKRQLLEEIAKWECDECGGGIDRKTTCNACNGTGKHPAAIRSEQVLDARKAKKEEEIYDKLLLARRFHASFVVIGTLSSRMSGSDSFNPQGIKHTNEVRACFTLADPDTILCGGDFESFEVVLADAVYNDPTLREELRSGKKIHALFAMELFPGETYESILKSKATDNDLYDKGKKGIFTMIYGGDQNTMKVKLGVDPEIGLKAYEGFLRRHPQVQVARKKTFDKFCSMRQPGGIGSKVEWHEPSDFVESLFGFRRYFTLENRICRVLFDLANKPPKAWKAIKIRVQRRDREQTCIGAVQSALYASAFGIQAANMRAAANHEIQSSGAQATKRVQRRVWDLQPAGVGPWKVQPMNIHDEVLCPTAPDMTEKVQERVVETVESFRPRVPLISMEWKNGMKNWAEK